MEEKEFADVKEELDILDDMLSSLVDLLIEKRIITDREWNKRVKAKLQEKKNLKKI